MKYYIDVNACCQDGLSILWDKWKAWEAGDHPALMELRKLEDEHLAKCSKCNPELVTVALANDFFRKVGKVVN